MSIFNANGSAVNTQKAEPYSIAAFYADQIKAATNALPAEASADARAAAVGTIYAGAMIAEQLERVFGEDDVSGGFNSRAMLDEIAAQLERIATHLEKSK